MQFEKFTQKAQESVEGSISRAQKLHHQQIEPEHLTIPLLEQKDGLIPELIQRLGIPINLLINELYRFLENMPKIQGGNVGVYASGNLNNVFIEAESYKNLLKDDYISVEHLFLALSKIDKILSRQLL